MVHLGAVLLCEALGGLTVSIGQFAPCMCVFSIIRCVYVIRFVVASFALWFCDCVILLSIALRDTDIEIQRRHIELEKDELERQLATNNR